MALIPSLKEQLKEITLKHAYCTSEKPITLSSGAITHEYFDGKQITLFPDRAALFARIVLEGVDFSKISAVGGLSVGADPVASAISLVAYLDKKLKVPAFLVRKETKAHGLEKKIEGIELKAGMSVAVVDDVITQGTATFKAIEAVEATGAKVAHVICLVDREQGGGEKLAAKYPFFAVFKKSDFK